MKKIVLLALVAVTAFACKNKVAPVEEVAIVATDSIVMVDGLGEVVKDVYVNQLPAAENVPAESNTLSLHHQAQAKEGVFELAKSVTNAEGVAEVTTEAGRFTLDESGELPVYTLTTFGEGGAVNYWALNGVVLQKLDANKVAVEPAYIMGRDVAASTAVIVEPLTDSTVVEEVVVTETATPAN